MQSGITGDDNRRGRPRFSGGKANPTGRTNLKVKINVAPDSAEEIGSLLNKVLKYGQK